MAALQTPPLDFEALAHEVRAVGDEVSSVSKSLSAQFFDLARAASEQTGRVEQVLDLTGNVRLEDRQDQFATVIQGLGTTLTDFVQQVVQMSKQAVTMVRTIDGILDDVSRLTGQIDNIDRIAERTTVLALNARIEAERAGEAGRGFRVVAGEVRQLSRSTADLARSIKTEISTIADALKNGHATLASVASLDMTREIEAKDAVDHTLALLLERDQQINALAHNSLSTARDIETAVSGIVTAMQFEDRTHQRLEHVAQALIARDGTPATAPAVTAAATAADDVTLF